MVPKIAKKANHGDLPPAIPPALPPSVEEAYRRKCLQLKRRTNEVEEDNEAARVRLARLRRGVEKLRLERAFLLDQLAKRTSTNVEDSEGSPSPPPTVRDEHEHGPSAHSPSPALAGPRSRQKPLPSGVGSATGTDHDLPLRQPQDKPLRSKRGHRKPSVVASLEPSNGPPPTFINSSVHNLSPSSDAFSHSVTAGEGGTSQQLKEPSAPRSNGVSGNSSKASKKPSSAFELYCSDNRAMALESKAEGVSVEEELARGWKDLPETQREEYKAKEKADAEEKDDKEKDDEEKEEEEEEDEEDKEDKEDKDKDKDKEVKEKEDKKKEEKTERSTESQIEDTPAQDEDVDMDNED